MAAAKQKQLVPKLRFPEFTDEPGWATPTFSSIYRIKRNNTFSRERLSYTTGEVRNIHYGDIHTKFRPLFDLSKEHVPYVLPEYMAELPNDEALCEVGDIVFADASEDLTDVGKAIELVALHSEAVVAGTHTILASRKEKLPVVGFGGQLFQSKAVRAAIMKEAQGAKVCGISANRISGMPIPLPPTETEQQKIADCLGSLDDLIDAESRKLEALRDHKKGLMQQLFPQPGETIPRLRFPEFQNAGGWEETKIGMMFDTGSGGTPTRSKPQYWEGKIPWITTSDIDFNVINTTTQRISESGLKNSSAKTFPAGTVLVAMYGEGKTRGKVGILGIAAATNQACAAIYPSDKVLPFFVFQNLAGRYDEMRGLSNSGGQKNLSQALISEMPFCYPSDPREQQRITDFIILADRLIERHSKRVVALKIYKRGLLQQLFPSLEGNE
ncbi:restriction endonuclease subunit S [Stappia sp.]|uniref:restriction endonuclease subunit S n=1 Tax=Stappia sp. TaxID=1870903 RepID=UPI003D0BB417